MSDVITFDKEMAITRKMFLETLARALGERDYRVDGARVLVEDGARSMELALLGEGVRRLGSFTLPAAHVRITLTGHSADQADDALAWFDRWFQRAGG